MKNIYGAFVKAQKAFSPALKSSTNPHFKSKYVDLAGCVEAVMDALNANGIALVQQTHESDSGVIVETVFIHESGEVMSCGKLHVPATKHDAQGYGSALTYARRYSLMAACGIAPEDDDGNAASKTANKVQAIKQPALGGIGNDLPPKEQSRLKQLAAWVTDNADTPDVVEQELIIQALDETQSLFMQSFLNPATKKALGMVFVKAA